MSTKKLQIIGSLSSEGGVGKNVAGTEYEVNNETITANTGAEVFNDYTNNIASGTMSHAEGCITHATGAYSHAEGYSSSASGIFSHAENHHTTASGGYAHAEGSSTIASGDSSHAEGDNTTSSGSNSHAEGSETIAASENQHVQGKYNIEDTNNEYAHIVGNGDRTTRSNAHTLDWDGNAWFAGALSVDDVDTTRTNLGVVPTTRTINGNALSADITLSASDVGALPDTTTIPSKTSDLTNDSGFITGYTETDPTVPSWAKASTKPTYTASEVGALPDTTQIPSSLADLTADSTHRTVTDTEKSTWNSKADTSDIPTKVSELTNDSGYITSAPVTSVNGKTGAVTLSASDVSAVPTTRTVNSKALSANITLSASDVGADASGTASSAVSTHNASTSAHSDIRELINQLSSEKIGFDSVVQTTGGSETAVMSQKATTDALKGLSLGIASDGLIYIFVDGQPVGTGIPQSTGESGDVFGYVDENNTIVLNGALADGTYNIKYEMDDGSTVDIGDLVLDSTVYYAITSTLTNCTNSNSIKTIAQGESYSATISAKDGYELSSVKVTMGGTDISASAVSGGTINIDEVTSNIVITAVAEEIVVNYTNLADPTSADWLENTRISSSGFPSYDGITTSNWIAVTTGDVVRIKGIDVNTHTYARVALFNSSKGLLSSAKISGLTSADVTGVSYDTTGAEFTIASTNAKFIRICGELNGAASDVIITKNEEID